MKINSNIHNLSAKHRGNLKPTSDRIQLVTSNSEIAPLNNPWLYVQLGRLEGTFNALTDLDWGAYLERSLQTWVSAIRNLRDNEEAKLSSPDLIAQQTFDPDYLLKLNERLKQREQAAQAIRERISDPTKLAELSIQALLDTVNNGNPGQGVFTFKPSNEVLSQVLQVEKANPEFLAAFEKSNPQSVYVLSGLVEYLKQVDSSGELARALLANVAVELYLLTQNADEQVAHIISEGVERLVTGSKFNPDNPTVILQKESPLDLKIIEYGKNILQARSTSVIFLPPNTGSTIPLLEPLRSFDVSALSQLQEEVAVPLPPPKSPTVNDLLNELRSVDERSYIFINSLRETQIISDDQAIVLTLVAQDNELADMTVQKDFQTLENRIANHPALTSKNIQEIVRGIRFSLKYFMSNAYCKWVCDYLRDVTNEGAGYFSVSLPNYFDAKIPVPQVDPPKICYNPVTSDKTRFRGEIEELSLLVNKAVERGVIDQIEYDLIAPLFQYGEAPSSLPTQTEANEIARKLELSFYDLFYKVSCAVSSPEAEKYILELRKRVTTERSTQFDNLAKALDVNPLILQSYLITQKLVQEPEELPIVSSEIEPGTLKDTEITVPKGQRDKVVNDFISLFFGVYASDYSTFEEFKTVLLKELNKEFDINSFEKIEKNLEFLYINDFGFGIYKAYLDEKSHGARPSLDEVINNLPKYCKADTDVSRGAVNGCLIRLIEMTGLSLFYSKPIWNPILNQDDVSLDTLLPSSTNSRAYILGEVYLTHLREVGIPPTKEQLLRRTKGSIDESKFDGALETLNKELNSLGYAPLLVFNLARDPVRKIFAVYKLSNSDLDSLSSNTGSSKEDLAKALTSRKNEAGFNEVKAFDPDFEIALEALQAKAREYLALLKESRAHETITVTLPIPFVPTEDDIILAKQELENFLSKKENVQACLTPAKYIQEATDSLGPQKEALLKAVGINEEDITISWCFWKAKRHGIHNVVYFRDLLCEVKNRLDRDVTGKELLDSLEKLSNLTQEKAFSRINVDSIILHEFIEQANIPAGSFEEYVERLGRSEILSAYELGDYTQRRLQTLRIGPDEWKVIWASKRNGLFNSNPHHITKAGFQSELGKHRYTFSNLDELPSLVSRLNNTFGAVGLSTRIEFYEIPKKAARDI